jgi:DNA-binding SARP family transcriptional activator
MTLDTAPAGRTADTGAPAAAGRDVRLALLGSFEVTVDEELVPLPMNAQRVIAFVALQGHALRRAYVAGSLWLDSTEERAAASLRSALWRLNRRHPLVEVTGERLGLARHVSVDVHDAIGQAHRLLDPTDTSCPSPPEVRLSEDLLPDWYDDWVAIERERFRQLRVHALEQLCHRLTRAKRFGEAIEAGLAAMHGEPLRESAHRALVRTHLAEGNRGEALRQYRSFRRLLHDELGLEPTQELEALVAGITER